MAVFKCKMCGGSMQLNGQAYGTCPYCGTQQTFPKLDDERRAQMYDRASQFRRENEFDKALGIYEQILSEEPTDAEAYWSIVLCTYGIEYVGDPTTHKRIPTVNRTQYTSIFSDVNYQKALEYADANQKILYQNEATVIDNIQKGILEVASKEEPFDIFICYKESTESGGRTADSVYAQQLYEFLTKEGYRVFFSRITLEKKLGSAYEPYIFSALNSAKVMLAVGTCNENYNAVWVKNEWSRFLGLIKDGKEKVLIPVYKDMNPADLPQEFAYLQAQDLSKVGAEQDLLFGISKVIKKKEILIKESAQSIDNLLNKAKRALDDEDWKEADDFCNQVLLIDASNSTAYFYKLLAENKATRKKDLLDGYKSFENSDNYKRIINIGDDILSTELNSILRKINEGKKTKKLIKASQVGLLIYELFFFLIVYLKDFEFFYGGSASWYSNSEGIITIQSVMNESLEICMVIIGLVILLIIDKLFSITTGHIVFKVVDFIINFATLGIICFFLLYDHAKIMPEFDILAILFAIASLWSLINMFTKLFHKLSYKLCEKT